MAFIISSDDIKESLPDYDPAKAGDFHEASTIIADKTFSGALKIRSEKTVILMSGGSASGKTEYVATYLKDRHVIISDGTSSTFSRLESKINQSLAASKKVEMHAVWPKDFLSAFLAFLGRDRQFDPEHFYRTQSDSRKALLRVAHKFPNVRIVVVISEYKPGEHHNMSFKRLSLAGKSQAEIIEYIDKKQYTREEIKDKVIKAL